MNTPRFCLWIGALVAASVVGAASSGCNTPDPNFHVATAPGFSKRTVTVSFLGIYRKGRLDPAAWSSFGQRIGQLFGPECAPGFTSELLNTSPEWGTWVDTRTRQDGPTADILAEIAPKAQGRLVLVVHLDEPDPHRTPPQVAGASSGATSPMTAPPPTPAAPRRRGPRQTVLSAPPPPRVFSLALAVFSPEQKDYVAEIAGDSSSDKRSDAVEGFFERLQKLLPNAKCVGWDWSKGAANPPAPVDEVEAEPSRPARGDSDPSVPSEPRTK